MAQLNIKMPLSQIILKSAWASHECVLNELIDFIICSVSDKDFLVLTLSDLSPHFPLETGILSRLSRKNMNLVFLQVSQMNNTHYVTLD